MWGNYCPRRTSCHRPAFRKWKLRGRGSHFFIPLTLCFTSSQHHNSVEPSPGESRHIMLPLAFYWRGDVFVNCVVRLMKRGPLRTPEWPTFSVYCQHLKLRGLQNMKQTADGYLTDSFHCYIAQSFTYDAYKYLRILALRWRLDRFKMSVLWIKARFLFKKKEYSCSSLVSQMIGALNFDLLLSLLLISIDR